jgi:hypothetical protein
VADEVTGIWLKVSNARLHDNTIEVQLEGDREDREANWWSVKADAAGDVSAETFRTILDGLDKKRTVLARLALVGKALQCSTIRVQHTESRPL